VNTERPDHDGTAEAGQSSEEPAAVTDPDAPKRHSLVKAEAETKAEVEEKAEADAAVAEDKAEADVSEAEAPAPSPDAEAKDDKDSPADDSDRIRRPGPVEEAPADAPGDEADVPGDELAARRRRPSALIAAAAAAAVLLIGVGGALIAHAGGGSEEKAAGAPARSDADGGPPPKLALDGITPQPGTSTGGGNGIAPGEPNPYGTTFQATGTLPGGPTSAPVYWARGDVDEAQVTRLAKALGVEGTPVVQGPAWRVGAGQDGTGPVLTVTRTAPGMWTFTRYAPGSDNCVGGKACPMQPMDTTTPPVSEAKAEAAAAPVLKAVGQDDAKVDASQTAGPQRVVNANPVIGKLPTDGWTTGITVNGQGEVVSGTGQLAAPVKGAAYPVLSAERTLEMLNAAQNNTHRMGIGGCATPMPLKDRFEQPCDKKGAQSSVAKVSDAVFGLAAHTSQGRQLLVPSWMFTVQAVEPYVVSYPAVDPKYLVGEADPVPSAPGKPSTHNVKVDGYSVSGNELTVRFTGGVCGDYSVRAEESDSQVKVVVTETPWKDRVCIMIAKEFNKTVELKKPLGDRKVVGVDGAAVPLVKPGARLPSETSAQ